MLVLLFIVVSILSHWMQEFRQEANIIYYFYSKLEKPPSLSQFYLRGFEETKIDLFLNRANFIEVDLEEMKARTYRGPELIGEFPVANKGDPKSWTATPLGLYWVIAKGRLSFSTISKVYMPYSVKFHGKYYFHGLPYYPDGTPLYSQYSGGCIRLPDEYAKTIYDFAKEDMPVLILDKGVKNDTYRYHSEPLTTFPKISAQSYLVADLNNGFVFNEHLSEQKFSINSLTKLMTAAIVVNHRYLNRYIVATQEMIEPFQSDDRFSPVLTAGKSYHIMELLHPVLIQSSNDATEALTHFLGEEKTVELMNRQAESLKMTNTTFFEPLGLDEDNISTAQDLFNFSRYILNVHPRFLQISKGEKVPNLGYGMHFKDLENKNIFFDHPNFIGGKTSYISNEDSLFIFRLAIEEDLERNIVVVLLESEDVKNDTLEILKWLKANYFFKEEKSQEDISS